MFLVKGSPAFRPNLLMELTGAVSRVALLSQRNGHTGGEDDDGDMPKTCPKYKPAKANKAECLPPIRDEPWFYAEPVPCKSDEELAVQHPKYLGVYGRCVVPYKPEAHCMDPCDKAIRMDDLHYKPGKYMERNFEQYWTECFFRKPKRCCRKIPPERSVRVISNRCGPPVKKGPACVLINPMPCKQEARAGPCPKITMCGCADVAPRVDCREGPKRWRCRRRSCQYPSFSECQHEELNTSRPVECRCLEVPPMCLVYRYAALNRRGFCDPLDVGPDPCK